NLKFKSLMLIILFTTIIGIYSYMIAVQNVSVNSSKTEITISAINPINITSNSDFSSYASAGDGSKGNPYIIENLVIEGPGQTDKTFCININNTDAYFIIRNCTMSKSYFGIWFNNVSNGAITNNIFGTQISIAVQMVNCSDINITNNFMTEKKAYGIELINSSYNLIYNNTINGTDYDAIRLWNNSDLNNIRGNLINYTAYGPLNGYGILIHSSLDNNITDNEILNTKGIGISLQHCNYTNLINNTIINAKKDLYTYAIQLINTSYVILRNCTIINNSNGIEIGDKSNHVSIEYCDIIRNYFGIYIGHSNSTTIVYNLIYKNDYKGIHLEWVNNSDIKHNNISNNGNDGIYMQRCRYNFIEKNNISHNSGYGLVNNTVTYNWFLYNKYPTIYPTNANESNTIENNVIVHIIPPTTTTTTEPIPGFSMIIALLSLMTILIGIITKKWIKNKSF
ncbi:MAG: right-handed parallel beta-helix repeat-containing protein, partial [Candidatus Helarchaeota archaeon]